MCVNRPLTLLMRLSVNSRHLVVKFGGGSKVICWLLNCLRVRAPPPMLFKAPLYTHAYTYSHVYDIAGCSWTLTLRSPANKKRKGTWDLQTWCRGWMQITQSATGDLSLVFSPPPPKSSLLFLLFWLSMPAFPRGLPLAWALFRFCISLCLHSYLTQSLSLQSGTEFPKGFPENIVPTVLCKLCIYKQLIKNRDCAYICVCTQKVSNK